MKNLSEEQFIKELRNEIRLYKKRIKENKQSIAFLKSMIEMREKILERCVSKFE